MRFSTWNAKSLFRSGFLTTAARELTRCKLELVGLQEVIISYHTIPYHLFSFLGPVRITKSIWIWK
jgi:hypothetical protein